MKLGFDYALYYAWVTATSFAHARLDLKQSAISDALASYPTLLDGMVDLAQRADLHDLAQQLRLLSLKAITTGSQGWQQFADRLNDLLQERNLAQNWRFSGEQIEKLNDYFAANELLVECLKGAVVTDRQAILAGLLSPPAEQDAATG